MGMMPTRPAERIPLLDALRGFGLLGIFVVNIVGSYGPRSPAGLDTIVAQGVRILATDSFYPLFSLLFGIGFAMFLERASRQQRPGVRLYIRRTMALGAIGLAQFIFLEPRDILLRYAVLAVPLLAFRHASARVLVGAAAASLASFGLYAFTATPGTTGATVAVATGGASRVQQLMTFRPRVSDLETLPQIFACFLFGLFVWRSGLVQRTALHRRALHHAVVWGVLFGLAGKTLAALDLPDGRPGLTPLIRAGAGWALTVGYAAAFAVLSLRPDCRGVLDRMAPLGRMALTNYLLQSVVMAVLFSPAGLDMTVGTAACVAVAVAATVAQLAMSTWWLRRFHFGPAEWLWRTLTYGRLQPMRNPQALAIPG
jgi:uncharacterized protein